MRLETLSEHQIIATLVALALLLLSAWLVGSLFEKAKMPRVVGEITGGMLIGGSGLFLLLPDIGQSLFFSYEAQGLVLNVFYQLGLIFLMFLSGYNTKLEVSEDNRKLMTLIFIGATILPIAAGIPFVSFFQDRFIGEDANSFSFTLVFLIGIAVTSIPVISKIFFDMGVIGSRFANTVLTIAAFQDLCLWVALNIATSSATSTEIDAMKIAQVSILTIGLFIAIFAISKNKKKITATFSDQTFYTLAFVVLFLCVAGLYGLGVNIMYSSFIIGFFIASIFDRDRTTSLMKSFETFAFSFFVPVYFALVGVQLNVVNGFSWLVFFAFFALAFSLEGLGTYLMTLFTKLERHERLSYMFTMNARGGPGIVLATTALSYGIINVEFFTVLILTTMLSSTLAGWWLRYQQKRNPSLFIMDGAV